MATLALINGAPSAGKSTIAERYAEEHPLALVLDIDVVRGLLGHWRGSPTEAGLHARDLAIGMARTHLLAGHDVVVPQLLARIDFIERLEALSLEVGCPFVEVVLLTGPDEAERRFERRSAAPTDDRHRDASALQSTPGTPSIREYYERMLGVVDQRPGTVRIDAADGDVDGTYRAFLAAMDAATR
ncbi:AAA family ATPase [Leifsonia poae]|uniref:Uncharacterized protein n=1 Tax=Leifsonia poae TaxID=110933 RepID=A0A9W6M0K2_9MICO|nr:AAA family ATPase [Leifsonia poae]GLJ77458.1 hypothetical protein GCM10017584_30320 [Leifsonia poae]